jgi:hypothetical protein
MGPELLNGDGGYYLHDAQILLAGEDWRPYWPPGMLYLLAGISAILGAGWGSGLVLMLAIYGLFDFLLRQVFAATAHTNLVRLIFAVYPAFVHHSTAPLSQLPIAVCILGLVWGFKLSQSWQRILLWGVCLGGGILIRPGMAVLWPLLFLGVRLKPRRNFGDSRRDEMHRVSTAILASLLALTTIFAWEFKAQQMTGRWIRINEANAYNLYLGNNPWTHDYRSWWLGSQDFTDDPALQGFYRQRDSVKHLPLREQEAAFQQLVWRDIRTHPWKFGQRLLSRLRVFFAFDTYTAGSIRHRAPLLAGFLLLLDACCYLFLLLMAVNAFWLAPKASSSIWWLWIFAYAVPYLLAFSHPNYHLPIMPLLALTGLGMKNNGPLFCWKNPKGVRKIFWLLSLFVCLYIQLEWLVDIYLRTQNL